MAYIMVLGETGTWVNLQGCYIAKVEDDDGQDDYNERIDLIVRDLGDPPKDEDSRIVARCYDDEAGARLQLQEGSDSYQVSLS